MADTAALIDRISRLEHAVAITRQMRDAQKAYFKSRGQHELITARQLEKQCDDVCEAVRIKGG